MILAIPKNKASMVHEITSKKGMGGMILTGESQRTRRKTCPSDTFFTTNLKWTGQVLNPDVRGGRPANNRQNHGMAPNRLHYCYTIICSKLSQRVTVSDS
jgi:hypothetical protein